MVNEINDSNIVELMLWLKQFENLYLDFSILYENDFPKSNFYPYFIDFHLCDTMKLTNTNMTSNLILVLTLDQAVN